MTEQNVRAVLSAVSSKIPEDKLFYLKKVLENASDDKVDEVVLTKLYNPTHTLLFSIFLGNLGVDRFMLGDTGIGVAKLLLGWATCGIWPLIDIFVSFNRAKEKNFNKIMSIIQ